MKVGDTVWCGIADTIGSLKDVRIENENVVVFNGNVDTSNGYYFNLVIKAVGAGETKLIAVTDSGEYSYTIQVSGEGTSTTAPPQTTESQTTTTTTTTIWTQPTTTTTTTTWTQPTTTTTTTTWTQPTTTTTDNPQTTTQTLGDVNLDGKTNAPDAAAILVAAAAVGSGEKSGLTQEQEANADVNGNGGFDAQDAALVLRYAAAVGSGYIGTLEEYLKSNA